MSKSLEDDLFFDSDLSSLSDDTERDELEPDDEPAPAPPPTASSSKAPAKKAAPARKPGPSRSKQKEKDEKPYVMEGSLRPPRNTQLSVRSLHEQITNGTIDLDPDYQRDVVWTEAKQIGIIDSIFRNFYVPPVIFAVSFADDGSETKTCIDGKQRLTSIRKFVDGLIYHRDSVTGKKLWYNKGKNSSGSQLPKNWKQIFDNKQITCMEYTDLSGDQEREIFQRVQLGVALTPAERMQAITGPRASFVRRMMDDALGENGFGEALDWGRTRGRDFQGLASIVYLIDHLPAFKTPASSTMETWLNKPTALSQGLQDDIESTLKIFHALTTSERLSKVFHRLGNKELRISPVEFVFIGILVHKHKASLSLTQLSKAIEDMRKDVRQGHSDIRTNTKVSKRLYNFITTKVSKDKYKADGKGEQTASQAVPLVKAPPKKRKRVVESESESEDSSSEEEVIHTTKSTSKTKASTSATGSTNGKARASASKASASTKKESPAPAPKSAKKPKVDPPVFAASSKPGRINASSSAGPSTASAIRKNHGVSSSVKDEPGSPVVSSGSFSKPGPASSKRAAAAKAEQTRAADALKQSDSPASSVPNTPVVQQPADAPDIPGVTVTDPAALMQFLAAANYSAIMNGLPVMGTQRNFANGSASNGVPSVQGAGQPPMFPGAVPGGGQFPVPPFAQNMVQSQTAVQMAAPASQAAQGSNAPQTSASAPPSRAPPLGPAASAPSVMHSMDRPHSSSQSRQPPRMPASMMASRNHSSNLPPKPQVPPPQLPPDDVLSGSPEISRRSSMNSFPSSASYPQASYPSSASPTNSSFSGRGGYERNDWGRGQDRERDHYQDRGGHYSSRPHSYRDDRRGSGQYGYRSDYGRDSGWR